MFANASLDFKESDILAGFNAMAEKVWNEAICDTGFVTQIGGRGGPDPTKAFVALEGGQPADYRLKLNFEAVAWCLNEDGGDSLSM